MASPIDLIAKAVARADRRDVRLIWATATGARTVRIDGSDVDLEISSSAVSDLTPDHRVLCIRDGLRLNATATTPPITP